jgi:protein-tyrosine phosphatase
VTRHAVYPVSENAGRPTFWPRRAVRRSKRREGSGVVTGRDVAWEGCVNGRDLGGLGRIRPGAVVRMEAPEQLTAAGWAAAWAHGIRTVLDLREAADAGPDAAPRPAGLTTIRVPVEPVGTPFYQRWDAIDGLASPLYYPALLAEHPDRVVAAIRAVATAAPGGVLVHCASGKDRTGLVALVLLALAGATPEEVVADHLPSYANMQPRYDALGYRDQLTAVREVLARHGTTVEASLTTTVTALRLPELLLDNGMTPVELRALEARLF